MTPEIEKQLKTALKFKKSSSDSLYSKACDAISKIGDLGAKKKHQPAAVEALRKIIDEGIIPLPGFASYGLSRVVTEADDDLVPYCRERLHVDQMAHNFVCLLLKVLGKGAFPDAAAVALNESLHENTRYWVLETLDDEYGFEFTENIKLGGKDFPLEEIRAWADGGYSEQVEVPIEIPTARLKKERIKLPKEYLNFLESHRSKTVYLQNDCCWRLTEAAELFKPTGVDGQKYPNIRQLAGFADTLRDVLEDDATVDRKEKPYPLSRLAAGWAIGTSDSGDVLYLDPADGCGVWVYHHDGGDVEKAAKAFRTWRNKAKKA